MKQNFVRTFQKLLAERKFVVLSLSLSLAQNRNIKKNIGFAKISKIKRHREDDAAGSPLKLFPPSSCVSFSKVRTRTFNTKRVGNSDQYGLKRKNAHRTRFGNRHQNVGTVGKSGRHHLCSWKPWKRRRTTLA